MLNHYAHIRLDVTRKALELLQTSISTVTSQSTSQNHKMKNPPKRVLQVIQTTMGPTGLEPMTSCV
jgi:hypothetical protein